MNDLIRRIARLLAAALALTGVGSAHAVASYARQTGSECAACHIGAYGPHLTPHGIRFKLSGYADSDGKDGKIPLAMEINASRSKPYAGDSDTRVTSVNLYLAGKIAPGVGSFISVQHSEGAGQDRYTALNDLDIRMAREGTVNDKAVTYGLTVNNSPGVQDLIDALPAWGFGAFGLGRDFVGTRTGSLLNKSQGGLAHRVIGVSGYGLYDKQWYGELGTYRSLSQASQRAIGLPAASQTTVGDPGDLQGALYWRGAYMQDWKTQFLSVGLVGLQTKLQPGPQRVGPSDKVSDLGLDFMYEYLGTREHVLQVRGFYIKEHRDYGSTPPNFITGAPSLASGTLREKSLGGTYTFRNTVGITAARTWTRASKDPGRFTAYGAPDTTATFIAPFWTVLGREDSPGPAGLNLQFGAVWLRWDKINTTSANIFGPFPPLDSKNLNAFILYARVIF